ncbi:MAG: ABC transporter ATP-binding protein [Halofilum sp. (in: g-proteobacteria)]|nr:ABC transporter ATP-binding protein [Halofilum sp. (in: g-proteobacteria)]
MHEPDDIVQADRPAIRLDGLRFRWPGAVDDTLAIEHFEVRPGERVFVRGPSGGGKSTLLGLVGGVLEPTAGELSVFGHDLVSMPPAARDRFRADHVGFVFQQFNLLPYLGVIDNVLLGARFSPRRSERLQPDPRAEARRCLAALGLDREVTLAAPVTALSVGQQQRVAVARALLGSPALVIADEPTSALDADNRRGFLELLFAECAESGATLLFVSHDAALSEGFERVIDLAAINGAGGGA